MTGNKKRFFSKHAKSSAIFVSLVVHAVIIVLALSMVAITVITKEVADFVAKQVKRPKMPLKKLQVPVNVKKPPRQPKLRKQIVATPKINKIPDIKMPEIVGVKGGLGSAGRGGLGGAASLGFSMPEFDMFGIKGKGEKVFIILDSTKDMMYPEMGGILAYELIKDELVRILGSLPATTLFNISVYDNWNSFVLFPKMVPATRDNVARVDAWLEPLNAVELGRGADEYGVDTLGPGGKKVSDDFRTGKFEKQERWHRPVMIAMKEQADAIFLQTTWWGHQRITLDDKDEPWYKSAAGRKWLECWDKGKQMYAEENKQLLAKGEPPLVLRTDNSWVMNAHYFPDIERPPEREYYYHTPREFLAGMIEIREKHRPKQAALRTGLRGGKSDFSFNVIHFKKAGGEETDWIEGRTRDNFSKLTSLTKGDYQTIAGLEAIKSSIE
jgi:hypothetical protein